VTPRAALWTGLGLAASVGVGVWRTTPWRPFAGDVPPADPARDLTADEIARARSYSRAVTVPRVASAVTGLGVTAVLGLTPAGARVASSAGSAAPWPLQVVLGGAGALATGAVVTLPFAVWRERARRRYGLSVQRWWPWAVDRLRDLAVESVLVSGGLLVVVGTARAQPHDWWAPAAATGAGLVLALSFGAPLILEPLVNTFTPLPAGELREQLIAMAARDGVRVTDVLVCDASRRTTALNAYVSGFGATRRIVVYDTLLARPADEVRLVVAHELGHAARRDVVRGTVAAAAGTAAAVALLGFLLSRKEVLTRAGVDGPDDPRAAALILALISAAGLVGSPAAALVSRRIEARADVHSLEHTRDPAVFTRAMRELAVTNVANPYPHRILHALTADHPSIPERIALARAWATAQGVVVPPDLAPGHAS